LLAFPDPFRISVTGMQAAALAVGAAALWAGGTVLGRMVSAELSFVHVTTLRFTVGLLAMAVIAGLSGSPVAIDAALVPRLILLALVPGLAALLLYYFALRSTPASRATLAELAFPVTAAIVGVTLLDARLDASQWLGGLIVVLSVVLLAVHEQRSRRPAVATPHRVEDAISVPTGQPT
jgi:drug/metabolite transporter (DMT)-like permease